MIKQQLPKIIVIMFISISFSILFFIANWSSVENIEGNSHLEYNTARIIGIISDNTHFPEAENPEFRNVLRGTIVYEIEVLRGSFAGLVLEANYHMHTPAHVRFEIGDRVSVRIFELDEEILITEIRHPERTELILGAIGLFVLFLCLIGGKRGILAVAGLIFTVICVMFLLIPFITAGYPVVLMTLIILTLVTIASITLLADISIKGISAILGCLSGVGLATVFSHITGNLIHISGYNMVNYVSMVHLTDGARISGLFVSSVLVASIGAIMDSSMSVASAMEEVKLANSEISMMDLFKAGFNVSRDVMGTMSSTLILAFIGGSLSMMIFMYTTNVSFNQFVNNDYIAAEIIKGVAGSFGIILAAPLTALISAKLMDKKA